MISYGFGPRSVVVTDAMPGPLAVAMIVAVPRARAAASGPPVDPFTKRRVIAEMPLVIGSTRDKGWRTAEVNDIARPCAGGTPTAR